MNRSQVNILWVESRTYLPEDVILKHSHPFFHYIFVAGGNGEVKVGDKVHRLTSNCIYLIKPNEDHSFFTGKTEKLVTQEVKFEVYDNELLNVLLKLPSVLSVPGLPIYEVFTRIHSECITKKPFYKELSECLLKEVIFYLKRSIEKQNISESDKDVSNSAGQYGDFDKIIIYIKNNVDNNITLQELSDLANLEKTYFVKKFKSATGSTPMHFVKQTKLHKAKKLLLYSDMNITQIAETLSFSSIHRFSEFFYKETGLSPQKFKKQEKTS